VKSVSTAIFYDLENFSDFFRIGNPEKKLNKIEKYIEESQLTDKVVLRQAFISSDNSNFDCILHLFEKHKIEIVKVDMPCHKENVTNLVDFKMNVYIADYVARKRSISTVILATGDGDFTFLCELIKSKNKKLVILSDSTHTNRALIKICDDWIDCQDIYSCKNMNIKTLFIHRLPLLELHNMNSLEAVSALTKVIAKDYLLNKLIRKTRVSLTTVVKILNYYEFDNTILKETEEHFDFIMNYLLSESAYKTESYNNGKYLSAKPSNEDDIDIISKDIELYNTLISKKSNYNKTDKNFWYTYFKENKMNLNNIFYYSSLINHEGDIFEAEMKQTDCKSNCSSTNIDMRIKVKDKEKLQYWYDYFKHNDNLDMDKMYYYYSFFLNNKVISEKDNTFNFVVKTKYKNAIIEDLISKLNRFKLPINDMAIKNIKSSL